MFTMMKILFAIFLTFNAIMIGFCITLHFGFATSAGTILLLYRRFFYKCSIIARRAFLHPLLFIKYIFEKVAGFLLLAAATILHPNIVLSFYAFFIALGMVLLLLSVIPIRFFIKVLIFLVSLFFYATRSDLILLPAKPVILFIWTKLNYAGKLLLNASLTAFEDMMGIRHSKKEGPAEYCRRKVANYYKSIDDALHKKDTKTRQTSTDPTGCKAYLGIMFREELENLGLYGKNFTMDDLNKQRKTLLKLHHPDNFSDPDDISLHQEQSCRISASYTVIKNELQKFNISKAN